MNCDTIGLATSTGDGGAAVTPEPLGVDTTLHDLGSGGRYVPAVGSDANSDVDDDAPLEPGQSLVYKVDSNVYFPTGANLAGRLALLVSPRDQVGAKSALLLPFPGSAVPG